jgi:asparagine synthase (glutamine-hydrolysing)
MCGITGASWTAAAARLDEEVLRRMTETLAHRGPDDAGCYFSPHHDSAGGAALGHRRLSIIDLAGGHQPLSNEDGTVWIAFNGEIYNYRELHAALEAQGHRFRTASDTETIVHLYEQHGPDCVRKLRGMFAFALWDERERRLFLARDRLGKKPLIYRREPGRLLFASELKALLQVPGIPREVDPIALAEYVALQYVPYPKSILKGFAQLPPAHWALFSAATGELKIERYWSPPYEDQPLSEGDAGVPRDDRQWGECLRETLNEAVRLRLRSDVPLGAFLSGGIDSTIITGLMQQQLDRPVQTFSIGFPVRQFDERVFARAAAEKLGTEHHELVVDPSAVEILPKLIRHYDQPFADSSAIPTMYLSEFTRRHVTVALTGDGGDELFSGYDRYQAVALAAAVDRWPRWLRASLTHSAWQRIPSSVGQKSRRRRAKRFLAMLGQTPERRYLNWISIFDDRRRADLLSPQFQEQFGDHDAAEFILDAYARHPGTDFVRRTTAVDVETYLPCDILVKVDIASMAYGLECRCPFLDHRVAELAARMPQRLKQHGGKGKRILREVFADLLPESNLRRPKMGFGVPLDHWFRHELKSLLSDTLLSQRCLERGYFRPDAVRNLVDEHLSSQWDHSARLWSLLVLELWHREWIDQRRFAEASSGQLRI